MELRGRTLNSRRRTARRTFQQAHLEVNGAALDIKLTQTRSWTLVPGSAKIGRHYTVDASTPDGEYRVYVRVVPYDAATGASLWSNDTDQWNNSACLKRSWWIRSRVGEESSAPEQPLAYAHRQARDRAFVRSVVGWRAEVCGCAWRDERNNLGYGLSRRLEPADIGVPAGSRSPVVSYWQ